MQPAGRAGLVPGWSLRLLPPPPPGMRSCCPQTRGAPGVSWRRRMVLGCVSPSVLSLSQPRLPRALLTGSCGSVRGTRGGWQPLSSPPPASSQPPWPQPLGQPHPGPRSPQGEGQALPRRCVPRDPGWRPGDTREAPPGRNRCLSLGHCWLADVGSSRAHGRCSEHRTPCPCGRGGRLPPRHSGRSSGPRPRRVPQLPHLQREGQAWGPFRLPSMAEPGGQGVLADAVSFSRKWA